MENIPDDPIIRSMERTGYPPWLLKVARVYHEDDIFENEEDDDEQRDFGEEDQGPVKVQVR